MRGRGITYDTGFVRHGVNSRRHFDAGTAERELLSIREELHCSAVRITGGDADRLEVAAELAAGLGLEVWFSPYPLELTGEQMLTLFADCADRAERLRQRGGEVVFVTGAELSLMNQGFLPGDTMEERLALLQQPHRLREMIGEVGARVNAFLAEAVAVVRERFGGKVTYASVPIDRVDWTPFDIVAMDVYRSAEIAATFAETFAEGMRSPSLQGKPVAITEFGSATYRGAGDRGALGLEIVEYAPGAGPVRLTGEYERDEDGQATYLRELLEVFDAAGVDTAFVFLFALHDHPHRPGGDPRDDLDLASYGIVRTFDDPDRSFEPKAAFHAVADYFSRTPTRARR
ncbi:hypothetical protein [Actinoplanes sp. GCM10030250]|uniref:hypothetical protein n=1 Tax=Actinoplanes sp. GCM10030250 TaxID=3273376 RepID=UPI003621822B